MLGVVFSKDRAAQLDLLLRSLERNAQPGRFDRLVVLWTASRVTYDNGYRACMAEHPEAEFVRDGDLPAQVLGLLGGHEHVVFFTDDDLLFGDFGDPVSHLDTDSIMCFSLRLGRNTTHCYPYGCDQALPPFEFVHRDGALAWRWSRAELDFGYPASLDGHVFRGADISSLLLPGQGYRNPNELEDVLVQRIATIDRPLMACYPESRLTGVPVNLVNGTHRNRHGQHHSASVADLNARYLAGERISLAAACSAAAAKADAAHCEIPYVLHAA